MLGRRRRYLSQHSYQLVQAIHAENERQKQIDRGMGYRGFAREPVARRIGNGATDVPMHIGPQIEAVRDDDGWAA